MSRAKIWMGILAVMIMALALGTSGALASYISLNASDNMTVTATSGLTFSLHSQGSQVIGSSDDPAESQNVSGTFSASYTGGTVLSSLNAANTATPATKNATGTFGITLNAPNPGGTVTTIGTNNTIDFFIVPSVSKTYIFSLSDVYSYSYTISQSGPELFDTALFIDTAFMSLKNIGGTVLQQTSGNSVDASYDSTPSSQTQSGSGTLVPTSLSRSLTSGTTYILEVSTQADVEGTGIAAVPVPSTLLLLGSGLVGLGLLRRKWSFKK